MTATDITFPASGPWIWRRPRNGQRRHAIRDDEWLPGFEVRAACGQVGVYPVRAGGFADTVAKCTRCVRTLGGDS